LKQGLRVRKKLVNGTGTVEEVEEEDEEEEERRGRVQQHTRAR